MANIILDLNCPVFQKDLFSLNKEDTYKVLKTLKKIAKMNWESFYQSQGLKWELIYSKKGKNGENIYSFRINKKFGLLR
jgi:plasmid maintenance system killer protein